MSASADQSKGGMASTPSSAPPGMKPNGSLQPPNASIPANTAPRHDERGESGWQGRGARSMGRNLFVLRLWFKPSTAKGPIPHIRP